MDRDLVLVLDDYHAIQNETIHSALLFLLEHLPKKLHLIILFNPEVGFIYLAEAGLMALGQALTYRVFFAKESDG